MISKNGITDFTLSLEELDKYPDSSRTSFSIGYDSETGKNHHFAIQLQLIENNPKIITNKKARYDMRYYRFVFYYDLKNIFKSMRKNECKKMLRGMIDYSKNG